MTTISAAFMLFLVIDAIGMVPTLMALLAKVERRRWPRIILRESLIALAVLIAFALGGRFILGVFSVRPEELGIAGGVVIFLIALRMIFPIRGGVFGDGNEESDEPFIVPIAIPLLAGPSAIAVVMLLTTDPRGAMPVYSALLAVALAWAGSLGVMLLSPHIARLLGKRALAAIERLMGLILVIVAVHMVLDAVSQYLEPMPHSGGEMSAPVEALTAGRVNTWESHDGSANPTVSSFRRGTVADVARPVRAGSGVACGSGLHFSGECLKPTIVELTYWSAE